MDDDELINAARAGQEYAGAFLVSLHGPALSAYCRSIAGDLSDTDREHVVANAIERAVRRIEKFDPARGPFRAWLRPFVVHAAQDWRRDHFRLATLDPDSAAAPVVGGASTNASDPAATYTDPDDSSATIKAMVDALRDAMPRLRAADQIIIEMRDFEARTAEDTARILGISPDACRQRHHRARRRLRDLLADDPRIQTLFGDTR